jgi:DNA-binding NarL/FixJ family response regulator
MKTRILLVDDYEIVREGLRLMLQHAADMEIVGGAEDGASALELATELMPDLILMDMELGDMDGIEASRQILEALPETRIMVLSGAVDSEMVSQGMEAGIKGFVVKTNIPGELIQAVRLVIDGDSYLCSQASRYAETHHRRFPVQRAKPTNSLMTAGARHVFKLTPKGLCGNKSAGLLHIGLEPSATDWQTRPGSFSLAHEAESTTEWRR